MSDYPHQPGNHDGAASDAGQQYMIPHAAGMCRDLLALLQDGPATPEELTEKMQARRDGRVLLTTVRARVCQLRAQGLVVDAGTRGLGESGKVRVIRWRRAEPQETAEFLAAKEAAQ
jgi:hypothetical protein